MKESNVSRRERRIQQRQQREEQIRSQRDKFQSRQRNKRIFNYAILAVLIVAAAVAAYTFLGQEDNGENDVLARCLTEQGTIMYGTDWCPHCQEQKRLFGSSFRLINYINCDLNREACDLAGVQGYPTWTFASGQSASGVQSLESLALAAECTDA